LELHGLADCEDPPSEIFLSATKPGQKLHRRRSRKEMMLDVLEAVKEGPERPTRIMYRANLSWSICQDLLGHLVERGLVRPIAEGERKRYDLTPKGSQVIIWSGEIADEMGD